MELRDIALIGLGVMGQNLALNMDHHGFGASVFNRTRAVTERFAAEKGQNTALQPCFSLQDLAASLKRPRKIILMVKAGGAVDAVIKELVPFLEPGDILVDGGNSHFADTARRGEALSASGLLFLGAGISGGEEGALRGPSIMPGGPREAYAEVEPIFQAIAAKASDGASCVAYLGPRGAGHYVKMVHNGIEYAVMQLIAETYDLLHRGLGLSPAKLSETFGNWNRGDLASYLVEITAHILTRADSETGKPMVDIILDEAEQKGTGKWTVQDALDLGVPIPSISAAVEARGLSAIKDQRLAAAKILSGPSSRYGGEAGPMVEAARDALFCGVVCAYAQGMALLRQASSAHDFGIDPCEVARIWRAGCIIRADLLENVRSAFQQAADLANLLLAPEFHRGLEKKQTAWRQALEASVSLGLPAPAGCASLAYYDAYRTERLPAYLTQAQRDYFGAHTYRRTDREGTFHTDWTG